MADEWINNRDEVVRRCREGISRTLDSLKDDELKATLDRILVAGKHDAKPAGPAKPASAGRRAQEDRQGRGGGEPDGVDPPEIAGQGAHPEPARGVDRRAGQGSDVRPSEPSSSPRRPGALESLRKQHPDDLSVAIAEALVALGQADPGRTTPALGRLGRWWTRTPLEALPEGARANSRQRAAARGRSRSGWSPAPASAQPGSERIRLAPTGSSAGARGGPPPGRQHGPDGDAARAGRAVAGARRPPGGRDRLVQDARDRDRAAEAEAARSPTATPPRPRPPCPPFAPAESDSYAGFPTRTHRKSRPSLRKPAPRPRRPATCRS